MADGRLTVLSQQLIDDGIDPGSLESLQVELNAIQHPPGAINRATAALRKRASTQWRHVIGELKESVEAMRLVGKGLAQRGLSAEDRDTIRSQMVDLVKVVPAGMIAVANSALPVPGTSMFTPWILARLGLMPSRWREAHLLEQLRKESIRLREAGHTQAAEALIDLQEKLEEEADERERAQHTATLLTHWDANENGVWDEAELVAYQAAVSAMQAKRVRFSARRIWYLSHEGNVFGPIRLSELPFDSLKPGLLICFDGRSGWVAIEDLVGS